MFRSACLCPWCVWVEPLSIYPQSSEPHRIKLNTVMDDFIYSRWLFVIVGIKKRFANISSFDIQWRWYFPRYGSFFSVLNCILVNVCLWIQVRMYRLQRVCQTISFFANTSSLICFYDLFSSKVIVRRQSRFFYCHAKIHVELLCYTIICKVSVMVTEVEQDLWAVGSQNPRTEYIIKKKYNTSLQFICSFFPAGLAPSLSFLGMSLDFYCRVFVIKNLFVVLFQAIEKHI